jgi:hypothetical protein
MIDIHPVISSLLQNIQDNNLITKQKLEHKQIRTNGNGKNKLEY